MKLLFCESLRIGSEKNLLLCAGETSLKNSLNPEKTIEIIPTNLLAVFAGFSFMTFPKGDS